MMITLHHRRRARLGVAGAIVIASAAIHPPAVRGGGHPVFAGEIASVPGYDIIDLGTLGGWSSVALGINEAGQVTGAADTAEGSRHAFLWSNELMTDLGTVPPMNHSGGWDINNFGQIVGTSSNSGNIARSFLWSPPGVMISLAGAIPSLSAFALNDATQIVGIVLRPEFVGGQAFMWEDGVITDLGTLGGTRSIAWDINASGQVVGASFLVVPSERAFLWENGVMTNLGTLGGNFSQAFGINDLGQVVGTTSRSGSISTHPFLWDDGVMIDLGALGGLSGGSARAINNGGQVVGIPSFLYDPDEGMLDLHDLIPPDSGWFDLTPRDNNDDGQIVGSGHINGAAHAFLMSPCADIDGDGVCNWADPCPNDNPDDTDGDGICDSDDICPELYDNPDTDGDGVPDCIDRCSGVDDAVFAPGCADAIPTVSQWGLVVLSLLLLAGGKIYFGRRPPLIA